MTELEAKNHALAKRLALVEAENTALGESCDKAIAALEAETKRRVAETTELRRRIAYLNAIAEAAKAFLDAYRSGTQSHVGEASKRLGAVLGMGE